ncbi:alkyl hydroperoxide reductase AhpD [Actinorhabdospora filicis]|uniref:Alkyl hydroperoxide reductase AhpD n=1 Tax=Actinorhabdospora filicis TaxID=1785913 RepID=A0A9W6SL22_9ACTN|nr:carboxymuconolactone decarboxylase family protein [Actinorhabdospora filicis]GLZ77649.1 alkyl hydroperoxide reductase AhpD [Actinorhabdospora filicis]
MSRITHPAFGLPDVMKGLQAIGKAVTDAGVDPKLAELVSLRASQINGCGACVDLHPKIALKLGETPERLFAVAAWRESPLFTGAERAALALGEELTRIADRPEGVTDAVWDEAAKHFDEKQLQGLVTSIAAINVWNRMNVAVRQMAGSF